MTGKAASSPASWRCPSKPSRSNAPNSSRQWLLGITSCGCAVSRLGSSRPRPWTPRFKRWPKDKAARRPSASRTSTANSLPCPAPGRAAGYSLSTRLVRLLLRRTDLMRFNEINLFGLYVAPITVIMAVAWVAYVVVRRVGDRFGLTQRVWHPALFELALYVMIVSSIVLVIARWSR